MDAFVTPLDDNGLPEHHRETCTTWRKIAAALGYTGHVAWQVRAGFTLKQHAPMSGACYQSWKYLKEWNLQNDQPTKDSIVFWIPRLVPESTSKDVTSQLNLLAALRTEYALPAHHCTSFGSAALLSALILAHFKCTDERVPQEKRWTRTDTFHVNGDRLDLGDFNKMDLYCCRWDWGDEGSHGDGGFGCFLLGVEELGHSVPRL